MFFSLSFSFLSFSSSFEIHIGGWQSGCRVCQLIGTLSAALIDPSSPYSSAQPSYRAQRDPLASLTNIVADLISIAHPRWLL